MFKGKGLRKKLVAGVFGLLLLAASFLPVISAHAAINEDNSTTKASLFRQLTVDEIVSEMGTGWNLGNTMDGHTGFTPSETLWQSVETTEKLIDSVHDLGFNTVRIPVTWGTMIDDENGYSLNEAWISRVQDIVDYCISQDMYVIINIHHDGAEQSGWLRVGADDIDPVYAKFQGVWKNIAERFKNYDEHLIFESMNEIKSGDDSQAGRIKDMGVINKLNQIFVDTVRGSGSNNEQRFLIVPGRYTNIEVTTDPTYGFQLPTDTVKNRIFVSVHYYDWTFGMVANMGKTTYSYENATTLATSFQKLADTFTLKGIPVFLGEYGCINKDNPIERAYHVEIINRICQMDGVVPCYWDQGWYDRTMTPDYSYALVDRTTGETIDKDVTDAIMRGLFVKAQTKDLSDVVKQTVVVPVTDATLSKETLIMNIGDSEKITATLTPSTTNDVLLWKTADSSIATVYNGQVRGRGIGTTVLTAFSQSGSFEKTVSITVNAVDSEKLCTKVTAEKDSYELAAGQSVYLNVTTEPSDTTDFIIYKSSNEDIATVSTQGKVVAKSAGSAYIIMTASSGYTTKVKVNVTAVSSAGALNLALNVYYNDTAASYFTNESGQPITITEDGQYTVLFDCASDLSSKATDAGITGLNNLTAIYIKDDDVTKGVSKSSPLETCNIVYDKILVDGKEMTINTTDPKSALKSSGIFDTNDPFNSWDGSVVNEVEVKDHVLNIVGVHNPQKVEVTFTISDMVFDSGVSDVGVPAVNMTADSETSVSITDIGATSILKVLLDPVTTTEKVAFISSDFSVITVNPTAQSVDATGNVQAEITAVAPGTATVTAISESGKEVSFEVTVKEVVTGDTAQPLADEDLVIEKKTGIEKYLPIIEISIVGIVCIVAFGTGTYHITKRVKRDKK